jgi:DNA-binding MarR family transcriptional regulator
LAEEDFKVAIMGEGPRARSNALIVEQLGEELLVYDTNSDRGHSLSPEAAKVWRACDGNTSAEALSAHLGLDLETVSRALDELSGCELLEVSPTIVADGSTRREVTLKLAKAGAVVAAAPLILSVAAPMPAQAATAAFCRQFNDQSCGMGNNGCKSEVGCCCCTPPDGCVGTPQEHNGCKTCVPIGSSCPVAGQHC